MHAVSATFAVLPAARSRSYMALMGGLQRKAGTSDWTVTTIEGERGSNNFERGVNTKGRVNDNFLILQRFVVLKKATHLSQRVVRELDVRLVVGKGRIQRVDGNYLVVVTLLDSHVHDPDGSCFDNDHRMHAMEHPVESQYARSLVQLLLVRISGSSLLRLLYRRACFDARDVIISEHHLSQATTPRAGIQSALKFFL